MLHDAPTDSEIVIALVGTVGTELGRVCEVVKNWLGNAGYDAQEVHISKEVIAKAFKCPEAENEYRRIESLMDAGDRARRESRDSGILALGAAAAIASMREMRDSRVLARPKTAYIVNSLKHPQEVYQLQQIYGKGFYLVGVQSDRPRRKEYLVRDKKLSEDEADHLIARDENSKLKHGQRVADTFHLSDFFLRLDGDDDRLKKSVWRILEMLFSHPYRTPLFDEYAMFMAFAASLQSADLSRQVGAVVTNGHEVISMGANECPRPGGGQYWPEYDAAKKQVFDSPNGRDFTRGVDANKKEQQRIIDEIVTQLLEGKTAEDFKGQEKRKFNRSKKGFEKILQESSIADLTEYGRVVHAEMASLLACARLGISTVGATLYCTTFPCHNCAKHIVAAGVARVVYVEPYEKSKAIELHGDAIVQGFSEAGDNVGKVAFEPFVGVGPRRFFDLFSMKLGSGTRLARKDESGETLSWSERSSRARVQMLSLTYLDLELLATKKFNEGIKGFRNA